jgi:DNA-binding PadR family transcriptional regulator
LVSKGLAKIAKHPVGDGTREVFTFHITAKGQKLLQKKVTNHKTKSS